MMTVRFIRVSFVYGDRSGEETRAAPRRPRLPALRRRTTTTISTEEYLERWCCKHRFACSKGTWSAKSAPFHDRKLRVDDAKACVHHLGRLDLLSFEKAHLDRPLLHHCEAIFFAFLIYVLGLSSCRYHSFQAEIVQVRVTFDRIEKGSMMRWGKRPSLVSPMGSPLTSSSPTLARGV